MSLAVIIIDVQRALAEGKYKTHDADAVIARLNTVTGKARASNVPVFFVQHEEQAGSMVRGEWGWLFAEGLAVLPGDTVVHKTASDSFHRTALHDLLAARGVSELIVGGMQSDFCVDSSVRRALALGYAVTLLSDGHTTLPNAVLSAEQIIAHHNATLSNISSFGPRVRLVAAADVL